MAPIKEILQKENLLPKERAKRFSKSSIEKILSNPFYEGKFLWNGKWHKGKHEVFVPLDWIRNVDGKRGASHKNNPVGVFSHLVVCGVPGCGSTIIYDPKIKVNKTTGESRLYHYYHCADGKRFHKLNRIPQVNVNETRLWESFYKPIRDLHLEPKMADLIIGHLQESNQRVAETADETRTRVRLRLSQMVEKEDELYQHWSSGLLTKDAYMRHLEKLKQETQETEAK